MPMTWLAYRIWVAQPAKHELKLQLYLVDQVHQLGILQLCLCSAAAISPRQSGLCMESETPFSIYLILQKMSHR